MAETSTIMTAIMNNPDVFGIGLAVGLAAGYFKWRRRRRGMMGGGW